MKFVDPIERLIEKASTEHPHLHQARAAAVVSGVPYEIPMAPAAGVRTMSLTVGSTYRTPVPILFDPNTRTSYPLPNNR